MTPKSDEVSFVNNSEEFYSSPSQKYKIIVWEEKSGNIQFKIKARIFGSKFEYDLDDLNNKNITCCWVEDVNGHDYFIYEKQRYSSNQLRIIELDTNKTYDCSSQTNGIARSLVLKPSRDKKHIAMIAVFQAKILDVYVYKFTPDMPSKLNKIYNLLSAKIKDIHWLDDELTIGVVGSYDNNTQKYSATIYNCNNLLDLEIKFNPINLKTTYLDLTKKENENVCNYDTSRC